MKPRDRDRRRRGFDDDFFGGSVGGGYSPPPMRPSGPPRPRMPVAGGPVTEGTVKWFNTEKGFGFVAMSDGTGDAFLHAAVLAQAGAQTVAPGTRLKLRTGMGQKGAQVTEVLEIDASTATEEPAGGGGMGGGGGGRRFDNAAPRPRRAAPDLSSAEEMTGTVKWYNPDKGFGFVAVGDGGKDVFVHASALERSGIRNLNEGQAVRLMVVEGMKGREAASVEEA